MNRINGKPETVDVIMSTAFKLNEEKRKYSRIPLQAEVAICVDDQVIKGRLVNLSLNGAFVTSDGHLDVNSTVSITISDSATSLDLSGVKARVVRVVGNGVGLQFQ